MEGGGEGDTCVCVFLTKHTKDNTVCVSIKAKNYVVHIHPTPDEIAVAWCIHIHIRYSGTVWHGTRLFFLSGSGSSNIDFYRSSSLLL